MIRKGTNEILRNSIGGYSTVEVVGTRESFNKTSCNYTLMRYDDYAIAQEIIIIFLH